MISKTTRIILCGLFSFFLSHSVCALESEATTELEHVKVRMLLEHEGFLLWYAKEKGWDREIGLDLVLTIDTSSGTDILNEKREHPDCWDITAIGIVPAIIASENVPIKIFGIANDESYATDIMVQNNSDILKTKGWSREYPNVYGDPESIKGKTFFLRYGTSSLYTLEKWLNIFGLTEKDINIVDCPVKEAITRMNNKEGDGMVLWSPENYEALKDGHQIVTNASQVGAFVPVVFIADYDYAEKHPDVLTRLLILYDRVASLQNEDIFQLILSYKDFLMRYTGMLFYEDFCSYDLRSHPTLNISEQISLFTGTAEYKSGMETLEENIAKRFETLPTKNSIPLSFFGKKFIRESTTEYLQKALEFQKKQ